MASFLAFLVFLMLLLIPFIPAIIEVLRPRDASLLFIRMDYSKDPRYFGRSFKNILKNAVTADKCMEIREVKLSKNERVETAASKKIGTGEEYDHILYILGDLISEDMAKFNKEVYVKGDATIGCKNHLRAIACDGRLSLMSEVSILRWADAEGKVEVNDKCNLGISISSADELKIGKDCKFKRLYGMPIITYSRNNDDDSFSGKAAMSDDTRIANKDCVIISPFTSVEKDFIVKKDLMVKRGCLFTGSIKTYGNLILENDIVVSGNIFSEGDIEIGDGTTVAGDIFSQGVVAIKGKVRIGSAGKVKSVIGKRGIIIGQDVIIHGYTLTEGSGTVV